MAPTSQFKDAAASKAVLAEVLSKIIFKFDHILLNISQLF